MTTKLPWLLAAGLFAQQGLPPRDPGAPAPMRPIPVGTASISGTVTTADGGRPVRDATVRINGAAMVPESALTSLTAEPPGLGRGSGPAGMSLSVNRTVATDASGHFAFPKLPAGHFTLSVTKNNYLTTNFGQKRPGGPGTTIIVTDGQAFAANATLIRGGVISGTVFGADGEPMPRVQVGAWRYQISSTGRRFLQNQGASTDDRGMYRLANLQPGDYLVGATPNGFDQQMAARMNPGASAVEQAIATAPVRPPTAPGLPATVMVAMPEQPGGFASSIANDNAGYLPTFFPGTPARASAQVIHIAGGDERAATDFTVQLVEAGSINVTLTSPLKPGLAVRASLISSDPDFDNNSSMSYSDPFGKLTLRAVPPGSYTVMVQTALSPQMNRGASPNGPPPQLADEDKMWGSAVVSVASGMPASVSVSLRPGRSIGGIVVFDTTRPMDAAMRSRMSVILNPAPGSAMMYFGPPPQALIEPDGRFTINGVSPGKFSLRVNSIAMRSSVVGGVDTLDTPIDFQATDDITDAVLTVTDKITELSGLLTESAGKPGIDYTIIAVTTDEKFWTPNSRRIALSRTGADGKYMFRSLPAGDYYVTVMTDPENGIQYDPEFLRSLAGAATRVHVNADAKTTQDLRIK